MLTWLIIFVLTALLGIYQKITNAVCDSLKRLDSKTVLVTGGTAGIGLEVAKDLAKRGAHVIIACPSAQEGQEAVNHIKDSTGQEVEFLLLDLSSFSSTRQAAETLLARHSSLHILINNAGVGGRDRLTSDGLNYVMQVNYIGAAMLTLLLLPLLKKSGTKDEPSRIVNTSSVLHRFGAQYENLIHQTYSNSLVKLQSYNDSKLYIMLFTRKLAKSLKGESVVVNCVSPGAVGTRIFYHSSFWVGRLISWFFFLIFKTPLQGAQTTLQVALDEHVGHLSGEYFENCRLSRAAFKVYNDKLVKKIWDETMIILNKDQNDNKTLNSTTTNTRHLFPFNEQFTNK